MATQMQAAKAGTITQAMEQVAKKDGNVVNSYRKEGRA